MEDRIAITGATGFVGQAVLNRLLETGQHSIAALVRAPKGRNLQQRDRLTWIEGDLDDEAALARLTEGAGCIIHIAGLTKALRRGDFFAANADGAERLAKAALGAGARRFVHISSLAASQPHLSHYAASKYAGEQRLEPFAATRSLAILRPPAIYGPGDRELLRLFRGVNAGLVPLPGAAANRLSFIFVSDLAEAIAALAIGDAATRSGCWTLDDGTKRGYPLNEVAQTIARQRGRRIATPVVPPALVRGIGLAAGSWARLTGKPAFFTGAKAREALHPDWTCRQNRLNEADLGWSPHIGLPEGIALTDEWYQSAGFY